MCERAKGRKVFIIDSLCQVRAWKITRRCEIGCHDSDPGGRSGAEREYENRKFNYAQEKMLVWVCVYVVGRSFVCVLLLHELAVVHLCLQTV